MERSKQGGQPLKGCHGWQPDEQRSAVQASAELQVLEARDGDCCSPVVFDVAAVQFEVREDGVISAPAPSRWEGCTGMLVLSAHLQLASASLRVFFPGSGRPMHAHLSLLPQNFQSTQLGVFWHSVQHPASGVRGVCFVESGRGCAPFATSQNLAF